jgi:hypothetical protein
MTRFGRRLTLAVAICAAAVPLGFGVEHYMETRSVTAQAEQDLAALGREFPDRAAEQALAAKYWADNPDVRDHFYFGEKGPLGVYGARSHFRRHGQGEGRNWPDR